MPRSDPHHSCLKCLGKAHGRESCKICKSFCPWTKKDQDIRLWAILMESTLRLASEPSRSDLAPSTTTSVHNAPPASSFSSWHLSLSPVPKKTHTERGHTPAEKTKGDLVKPASSCQSSPSKAGPSPLQVSTPALGPSPPGGAIDSRGLSDNEGSSGIACAANDQGQQATALRFSTGTGGQPVVGQASSQFCSAVPFTESLFTSAQVVPRVEIALSESGQCQTGLLPPVSG